MKRLNFLILALIIFSCSVPEQELESPRSVDLLNHDWLFHRGDIASAELVSFDDGSWRKLSLPHDWSIEDIPGTNSPLDPNAIGEVSAGFFVGGTSWYRKHFRLEAHQIGKRIYLQFDGIYMNADIWLNGTHLGNHPYGYTTFGYDITDQVGVDQENILAVQVKNEGKNSRWYSGSGIYRHVWLISTSEVYVPTWGIFITTPIVKPDSAGIEANIQLANDSEETKRITVHSRIINAEGVMRSQTINKIDVPAKSRSTVNQKFEIEAPKLWSPDQPYLYRMETELVIDNKIMDRLENTFGIRTIEFDVDKGFLLNGEPTLLKGGCMHHGNGPLGAAAYDRAEERRVELMKKSGFNAIRCAHNPPSEAFLDACDRLGIMVIDEAFDMWRKAKNPQDYHLYFDEWWQKDIEAMVLRDRNHPSIIMWSTGNEIPERGEPEGAERSVMLSDFIKALDPTRPVTAAVNGLNPGKDPYFATLDVSGYNYATGGDHWKTNIYQQDHQRVPDRIMYGAESYPLEAFGAWMDVVDNSFVIGDFVWTGFDYLGEASIGWLGYMQQKEFYPWSHAFCGDIDICGWKRPQSYYRDVLWEVGDKPYIFVVPPEPSFELNPEKMDWSKWEWHDVVASWNWEGHEGHELEVHVYNRSESVELFLNGKSLGSRQTNRENEWTAKWKVPYEKGLIKAVNFNNMAQLSSDELVTAGAPTSIQMEADRPVLNADGFDLGYIEVAVVDEAGVRNPTIERRIDFELSGPGEILAVASSNPRSTESYRKPYRNTFRGRCLLVVKSQNQAGEIVVTARSADLPDATIEIRSE